MRTKVILVMVLAGALLLAATFRHPASLAQDIPAAAGQAVPAYTPKGELIFPANYREWIFLSSGLDMSYSERGAPGHSMFDNVFVDRRAYQTFLATGSWPDQTVLVMESREASSQGSINVRGHFQTANIMGAEVHVRDTQRFAGGWAFFAFSSMNPAPAIPSSAACYSCHAQHGAVDTTFVQFYPTLLPVARAHGTVKTGD
jgi:hypothetical protein